jgi:murein DD-endopeptidase MepM/ murein hydrolase activator NlpD
MDVRRLALPLVAGVLFAGVLLWPAAAGAARPPAPAPRPPRPIAPGARLASAFGRRGSGFHYGVDLGASAGTPVYAPFAGVVAAAYADGEVSGYGNVVTIAYGDYGLLYSHLASMAVRTGERVVAGQLVGTIGSTNSEGGFRSSGPHLHFEVIVPAGGDMIRQLSHYTGSTPPRVDPVTWAAAHGVSLV